MTCSLLKVRPNNTYVIFCLVIEQCWSIVATYLLAFSFFHLSKSHWKPEVTGMSRNRAIEKWMAIKWSIADVHTNWTFCQSITTKTPNNHLLFFSPLSESLCHIYCHGPEKYFFFPWTLIDRWRTISKDNNRNSKQEFTYILSLNIYLSSIHLFEPPNSWVYSPAGGILTINHDKIVGASYKLDSSNSIAVILTLPSVKFTDDKTLVRSASVSFWCFPG